MKITKRYAWATRIDDLLHTIPQTIDKDISYKTSSNEFSDQQYFKIKRTYTFLKFFKISMNHTICSFDCRGERNGVFYIELWYVDAEYLDKVCYIFESIYGNTLPMEYNTVYESIHITYRFGSEDEKRIRNHRL